MKKGFTLIELLAVIVILAIIALIATPIALNIINDVKESATLRNAEYYLDAVEISIAREKLKNRTFKPKICEIQNGNLLCDADSENELNLLVESDGKTPSQGTIIFQDSKVQEVKNMEFDNLYVNINSEGNRIVSSAILITSLEVSYSHCLVGVDDFFYLKVLTDNCTPEITIKPENATNKSLEFIIDEHYYNDCYPDTVYSFNGKLSLNSATGELIKVEDWGISSFDTYTYITVKTTDGSNISKKIKVVGYLSDIGCRN